MYLDVFFRFDDETGEIHNPRIDRNALRHLFTKKTERERLEKQQRETILQVSYINLLFYQSKKFHGMFNYFFSQQLHRHKCRYLCLDPDSTPLFPQFPEYFYNPETREW